MGGVIIVFWNKKKSEKAIMALKEQLNINLYENGRYRDEKQNEYRVSISDKDDCLAVVNRKENGHFIAKEWFVYSKSAGWIKKAAMNRKQCIQLYKDTKPYYFESLLEEFGGNLPPEKEETAVLIICDEYLSSYMTRRYFGFSIKVLDDVFWARGESRTQAIYMPHRDSPPEDETAEERMARAKRIDSLVDQLTDVLKQKNSL